MRVLKFCLSSPLNGEKGDGKLVMGRVRGLKQCEIDIDVAYMRTVIFSGKSSVRIYSDERVSGVVIEVRVPLMSVVYGLWQKRDKLAVAPIQTWLSYGYAGSGCREILRLVDSYETVHFYHIRSAGLLELACSPRLVILDLIDSYGLNLGSRDKESRLGPIMRHEYRKILKAERNIDMFAPQSKNQIMYLTVSERDCEEIYTKKGKKVVVPVGTEIDGSLVGDKSLDSGKQDLTAVFFGNLNYGPNIKAAERLARYNDDIKTVKSKPYQVSFTVAGRHAGKRLCYRLRRSGIRVVSPVEDMKALVCSHDIVVLPMQSGSGMQSKLLEAIAWKRLVFASKLVAEPLGLAEGKEYIRVESSYDLDSNLRKLARGDLDASGLIKRSSDKLKKYDWCSTAQVLREIYINASGDCARTAWTDQG